MNSLDNILTGSEAAPEGKTEEKIVAQTGAADGQLTEGDTGTDDDAAGGEGDGDRRVPVAALQAERQKVKRYTEQVASFEQSLKDRDAAWERRIAQLTDAITPKQAPPAAPDFFENPQAATRHELTQAVSPVLEQFGQQLQMIARDSAVGRFTEEKVNEAEAAFLDAMKNRTLDPSDRQRVVGSPNRFAAAVQWYQRQQAQKEIGDDPAAFKAKVEADLREKILAEINGGDGQQQQQVAPAVRPSNLAAARNVGTRSGPAWSGPATLDDIFNRARAPT